MKNAKRIIIVGFMGSGKSTVAAHLASLLGLPLYEMDELIVEASGHESIPEIFEKHGEAYFRTLESSVAQKLGNVREGIIATGGGIVGRPENRRCLTSPQTSETAVIFLRTTFDTVCKRITDFSSRPLFKDPNRARELFAARIPLYKEWADITVDCDTLTVDEVCSHIIRALQET